ncbi:MAG: signal peptide peptidase SppA [Bacteroidales bacterium]|nr:signal peptide peptidase SppA [Bacteroidales bacterium]
MNFWKTFLAALLGCLVALILNLLLFFMLIGAIAASAGGGGQTGPTVKSNSILKIDLSQTIGERTQEGMGGDMSIPFVSMPQPSLGIYDAIKALDKAATDDRISMLLITDKGTGTSSVSALEELRNAVERFHTSGKPVVAYGMNYSTGGYFVASAADKIYMHQDGMISLTGLGGSMLFFKDALDMLGVNFQLIRHGKFKAAAEQYIKNDISPENRQQNMEMLNSIWKSFSERICQSRGIDINDFNKAIDNLEIGDGESAMMNSLVDSALTTDRYVQKICALAGVEKEDELNVITLSSYAKTLTPSLKGKVTVAVLYAEGEIAQTGSGIASSKIVKQIRKIAKDDKIDAVVLRVNSPGGDAQAAELIREELQALAMAKPLVCSFGEYAASGGYWISAQAQKIFSDETTLTGSIGVFSLAINYGDGLKKHLKINPVEIGTHRHSTMASGTRPLDNVEIEYNQKLVEHIYDKFMNIVADGRKMSVAEVDSIAQGRVWTGTQGVEVGIVDKIGGIDDAIKYAACIALGKEPDNNYRDVDYSEFKVVEYPKVKTQMELLMESFTGQSEENALINKFFGKSNLSELAEDFQKSKGVKTYARMPYTLQISY